MAEQPRPDEPGAAGGPAQPAPGDWGAATPAYAYPAPAPLPAHGYPGQSGYPGPPAPWYDPHDPLVNPPGAGLSGWFMRVVGVVRRSWRTLLLIMFITQFLPTAALGLVPLWLDPIRSMPAFPATPDAPPTQLPEGFATDFAVFFGAILLGVVVASLVQSVGWAAGTWAVTRPAAGQPAPLGAALAYGVRRAPGLWLWTVLSGLIIAVGVCMCVLPGIYFAFALALVGPVFLFERRNPIGRSFALLHNRFGMVLGRLALLAAVVLVEILASVILEQAGLIAVGPDPLGPADLSIGNALVSALSALLAVPFAVIQLAGLLATYAEQRGQERPTAVSTLAAELG